MTKIFKRDYYESLFRKRAQTVQDYYLQIAHAQDKIKELQAKCIHFEVEAVMYMWRPGGFMPSRVCKACNAVVGEAMPEESVRLWAEWNQMSNSGVQTIEDTVDAKRTAEEKAKSKA